MDNTRLISTHKTHNSQQVVFLLQRVVFHTKDTDCDLQLIINAAVMGSYACNNQSYPVIVLFGLMITKNCKKSQSAGQD